MLVGVRLRRRPEFRCQGFFHDVCFTPCRGDCRRADVLDRAGFRAAAAAGTLSTGAAAAGTLSTGAAAAGAISTGAAGPLSAAATPGGTRDLRTGRTGLGRPQVLRQRLAGPRVHHRARGQPMGPAQRLCARRRRQRRLCCGASIRRRHALHQERRRLAGLLAGTVGRLRLGRRRRAHHDAGLQPARHRLRSISASSASTARPISSAASA